MLLTITYTGHGTQDLGYLLHKNPYRSQEFSLNSGMAYVFYPEVSDEKTTMALLLDINPIDLAKGKQGSKDGGLFDYVNDRPYTASSFLSTAIARIFNTAMNGKCDKRQELADSPLDLTARIYSIHGREEFARKVFEPLGYTVTVSKTILDEKFTEWGESPYIDLEISGKVKLSDLLNHIYVLIPVFDKQKHYYIDEGEIDKLMAHGSEWLATHPAKEEIIYRYFLMKKSYAHRTINRLLENEPPEESDDPENITEPKDEKKISLNAQRMETVKNAVLASGAESVIDLGCGECRLTKLLLGQKQIKKITAVDVAVHELEKAKNRLHYDTMNEHQKNKLTLMQASLTYRDKRFSGYDCACVIEVIEHIEPLRLPAFERNVFEFASPKTVILTTPNKEYNANYEFIPEGQLRHGDHRFEWTREEFKNWSEYICGKFGYTAEISGIGENDGINGTPTQMAVFKKI
ncbi:MAG: 3' terminal RNA ribose 2'-O-methyltransferase Hen1 [Ruminococcus flavefaciens]|nr:3' terminal RNA ribose 2'-O-methyltransferase Hen1 [Ruminococcus flavefaciens]